MVRTPTAFWARTSIPHASQHAIAMPVNFNRYDCMMSPDRRQKSYNGPPVGGSASCNQTGACRWNRLEAIRKKVEREGWRILEDREKGEPVKPAETIGPARTTPAAQVHPQATNCRCDAEPIDRGRYRNAGARPDRPRPIRDGLPAQPRTEPMPATRRPTPAATPFSEDGGQTVLSVC